MSAPTIRTTLSISAEVLQMNNEFGLASWEALKMGNIEKNIYIMFT
jgi:hypothetical protein